MPLPSPNQLLRKILIKNKKLQPDVEKRIYDSVVVLVADPGNDPSSPCPFVPFVPSILCPSLPRSAPPVWNPATESEKRGADIARSLNAFMPSSKTIAFGYNKLSKIVRYNIFTKVPDLQLLYFNLGGIFHGQKIVLCRRRMNPIRPTSGSALLLTVIWRFYYALFQWLIASLCNCQSCATRPPPASERRNIYISRLCCDASPSVRLSVTEVHWRIIANLGFKFRSHFTAHCGRRAAGGRRAARRAAAVLLASESSRAMLASARLSCLSLSQISWSFSCKEKRRQFSKKLKMLVRLFRAYMYYRESHETWLESF